MIQEADSELAGEWPFLGSWDCLVRYLTIENEEGEQHPATLALRSLMYEAFRALRRRIEDPKCETTSWERPFLPLVFEYPPGVATEEGLSEVRPLLDLITAGRAAIEKKDGSLEPLLPAQLLEVLSGFPDDKKEVYWKRWVDLEGWTEPVSYGDGPEDATIFGVGGEIEFSASIVFQVHPRVVVLEDESVYDMIVQAIHWNCELPPNEWAEGTREALWKTVLKLLEHLSRGEGPLPKLIRTEVSESPLFSAFEARARPGAENDFSKRASFQVSKTVFADFPEYARGLSGPVLDITDASGKLKHESTMTVYGTMLYPDDEERRNEFIKCHRMKLLLRVEEMAVAHMVEKDYPEEMVRATTWRLIAEQNGLTSDDMRCLLNSPSLMSMIELAGPRVSEGGVAGEMLKLIIGLSKHEPEHASVLKAAYLVSQDMMGAKPCDGDKVNRGISTILEVWGRFRDVAHLWAAFNYWLDDREQDPHWAPWNELVFLSVAEYFREEGERCFARAQEARHGPVLDPTETWRPPPDLVLPEFGLEWGPTPEWALERLAEYRPRKSK